MPGTKKGKAKVLSVACAECKRLKLKCSKTVPCDACIRRGCESICPHGQLKAGKGTRFILSDTQELHEEIDRLRARVKELEDTIVILCKQQAPEPILIGPTSTTRDVPTTNVKVEEDEVPIDTFGSLTLKPDGSSEWHGRHMSAEHLFPSSHVSQGDNEELLPLDLMFRSKMFPFKSSAQFDDAIRKQVRDYLPPRLEGWRIAQEYYEHIAWIQAPFSWEEMVTMILEPVYNGSAKDEEVALFFICCAIGTSMNHQKRPDDPVARLYSHLARISLMLGDDLLCSKSLTVIRCLQGLAWFYHISLDPAGSSKSWMLTAMAVRMAQAAGLHRDSERWNKFPEEVEKRRKLWWEIATYEYIQSFSMARPRCIIVSQCDCKMPADPEDSGGAAGFYRKKYKWFSECLLPMMDEAASTKSPPYSTVIKHDRRLREYPMPDFPAPCEEPKPLPKGLGLLGALFRLVTTDAIRELALLYLHRAYLVEALSRWPEDPVHSRFGLSVLAVHRSSLIILQRFHKIREHFTHLLPRIIGLWLQGIGAYICLCAIVIRSPGCSLAPSSLVEIGRAREIFVQPMLRSLVTRRVSIENAEGVVEYLYEQAALAYKAYRSGRWPLKQPDDAQEQAGARVLHLAGASSIHTPASADSMDDCPSTSASTSVGVSPSVPPENIHPVLFDYLRVIQRGDTDVEEPVDLHTTEAPSRENLNRMTSSGYRIQETPTTSLTSRDTSNALNTGPGTSLSQPPPFQTPQTVEPSWLGFEEAQPSFTHGGGAAPPIDPPFDPFSALNSIFRVQNPSISTQHQHLIDGTPHVPGSRRALGVEPALPAPPIPDSIAGSGVQVGDMNARVGMDFARFMEESVPGLVYDGGVGWDTFFMGWQA